MESAFVHPSGPLSKSSSLSSLKKKNFFPFICTNLSSFYVESKEGV